MIISISIVVSMKICANQRDVWYTSTRFFLIGWEFSVL